ncbi:MAG: GntR family transcriptional regulator [Limibacillus sp.]
MALPRVRSSLSDRIAQDLSERILEGEFASGDRLPTESALAGHYDAGRSAVREAIARLRRDGIVVTRQGAGAFVAASSGNVFRLDSTDDQEHLRALYELRAAVECDAAALAAKRASPEALEEMQRSFELLERETRDGGQGQEASGNELFVKLLKLLDSQILEQIGIARSNSSRSQGLPEKVLAEHRAILKAVEARDPEQAHAATLTHLKGACNRLDCGEIGA